MFLIYESICDKELLSSKVVPEHSELKESRDVSGSLFFWHGNPASLCHARGAAICVGLPGTILYLWEIQGYWQGGKKKSSLSHPEVPMEIPEEPVTVNEKLQQGYIDWCYVMKDSVNGTCEGCGENILGYQTLSINVSVGKKMRKWLKFVSLFAANSQELENDEREFYKERKDALLPYT